MAFNLDMYPIVFRAQFKNGAWTEEFLEQPAEKERRNFFPDMPLVNYTTQYGLSCFEGLKALPQKNGGLAVFRADRNAARFFRSMQGLYMPPFPEALFVDAVMETVRRNAALGYTIDYDSAWEKDAYASASAIYIRPFVHAEGGIGVNISREPSVVILCSPVSAYFKDGSTEAVVTDRIRATPGGTGWIKAASNYVISALAKHEAEKAGFMECIFLDAVHRKYVEEGSSCNIFFLLKSGGLVTPELGDTILPGITRDSIIELARDKGVEVTERKISIDEALSDTAECFVSGTAAGATPITGITYKGKTARFGGGKAGEFATWARNTLKSLQYGAAKDTKGWLKKV